MGSAFTFWNTAHDYLKITTPNQSYTNMSQVKHTSYFSNPLELLNSSVSLFARLQRDLISSWGVRPTIIVGKLPGLASQAHRRPHPGPARCRTARAPAARQALWGRCAAARPPLLAASIGLKCLAAPLPPLFSAPAACLMIQLDSENREIGKQVRRDRERKPFIIADKKTTAL